MHSNNAQIAELHRAYVNLTGLDVRLDFERERNWFEWQRRGFTADDLRLVVEYLRRGIRERRRNPGALKFSNLIAQPDKFEEDLAEAKSLSRADALNATGRPTTPPTPNAQHVGAVSEKALNELRTFKEALKRNEL